MSVTTNRKAKKDKDKQASCLDKPDGGKRLFLGKLSLSREFMWLLSHALKWLLWLWLACVVIKALKAHRLWMQPPSSFWWKMDELHADYACWLPLQQVPLLQPWPLTWMQILFHKLWSNHRYHMSHSHSHITSSSCYPSNYQLDNQAFFSCSNSDASNTKDTRSKPHNIPWCKLPCS